MAWQDVVVKQEDGDDREARDPEQWMKLDKLWPLIRENNRGEDISRFEERVGWTFAAWTRLSRLDRYSVMAEREVVASILRQDEFRRFENFFAVGVQSSYPPNYVFDWRRYQGFDFVAVINVTTPMAAEVVDFVTIERDSRLYPPYEPGDRLRVPVIVQHLPPPILLSQVSQPTQSSGPGSPQPIHSSDVLYGRSPAGLFIPGLATAFATDSSSSDPRLVGSAHVLGGIGSSVDDAFGKRVGRVINADPQLDAAVMELDSPWSIDFRVRTLGVIPAAPLIPTSNMNVQFVDRNGRVQVGSIWQTNLIMPGQATIGVTPMFTFSCPAASGDSGALIMTGHSGLSAMNHYAGVTSPAVIEMYRSAMLGHVLAGAGGGPANVPSQTLGVPIVEVLASLALDPLYR